MAMMAVTFAMMIVPVAVVVAAIGLSADRSARRRTDNRTDRRASSAANRCANAGADTCAHKGAANRILSVGSARHRCERRQSSKSEKGLPHVILQPCEFALQRRTADKVPGPS